MTKGGSGTITLKRTPVFVHCFPAYAYFSGTGDYAWVNGFCLLATNNVLGKSKIAIYYPNWANTQNNWYEQYKTDQYIQIVDGGFYWWASSSSWNPNDMIYFACS